MGNSFWDLEEQTDCVFRKCISLYVYMYICISDLYFFVKLFFLHSVGVPLQTDCVFMRTLFTIPARLDLSYFCILCIFKPSAFTAECIQWHRSRGKLETLEQREYICYFILPVVKGHKTGVSDRKFEITTCPSGNTSATLIYLVPAVTIHDVIFKVLSKSSLIFTVVQSVYIARDWIFSVWPLSRELWICDHYYPWIFTTVHYYATQTWIFTTLNRDWLCLV